MQEREEKMNRANLILLSKYHIYCRQEKFEFKLDLDIFKYHITNHKIEITIESEKDFETIQNLFFRQYQLLFYIIGDYLEIKKIQFYQNEKEISSQFDDTKHLKKFYTNKTFIHDNQLAIIDGSNFANAIIRLSGFAEKDVSGVFNSFEYLHCKAYNGILINHRFLLSTHIIEGFCNRFCTKKEYKNTYNTKACYFYQNLFDKITSNNIDVFKILEMDETTFIKSIHDTRDVQTHLISGEKKSNYIKDGVDLIYLFFLFSVAFRLNILKMIDVEIDNSLAQKEIMSIRNWIAKIKMKSFYNFPTP